ncbi:cytochrome b5 [Drosophila tropicalis]|uniref:cytochrome b5 n=1 Tax=Drosophila tropicalis TaxID=46794 RepID=UPI0035ABB960
MSQLYDLSEISQQNGKGGKPCWLIIKGNVYDVTKFIDDHPGGGELLLEYGGKDATKAFNKAGHSSDAEKDLKQYKIGEVNPTGSAAPIQTQPKSNANASSPTSTDLPAASPMEAKKSSGFCCC